jgi:hypothetical protein
LFLYNSISPVVISVISSAAGFKNVTEVSVLLLFSVFVQFHESERERERERERKTGLIIFLK